MRKILLAFLATMLLPMILLGAFHQVRAATPQIPLPPHDKPPDLHFSILVDFSRWNPFYIGHAFVQLNDSGTLYTYGFGTSYSKGLLYKPGEVTNNSKHVWDYKITYGITVDQYTSIAQWINAQILDPPIYNLFAQNNYYNCMKWAATAAAQAGIIIPPYINLIGIPDPMTFGIQLMGIGDGNTDPHGGKVEKNTVSASPPPEPMSVGSYMLASSMCLEDPSRFASPSYFNATLDATSMGSYTTTVGHSVSFASSVSVNLSETIVAWNFGDGSNDYQMLSTSHAYSSQGDYAVTFIAISENTVWSRTGTVTVSGGYGGRGVGGIEVPVDKFGLLAPYIGSATLIGAVATVVYVRRVKRRKEKQ
jgi:hypothetical protein